MELEVGVQVCLRPIKQMATGWLLAPSRYEGDDLSEQIFGIFHISSCTSLCPIPFEAKSSLDELFSLLVISPQNDFCRYLREFLSVHILLLQVRGILGEALKKIFYIIFHGKCKNLQTCVGSSELGVCLVVGCHSGDM